MMRYFYNWHKLSAANIQNDKSPLQWAFNYFKITDALQDLNI
tara:strand:+ start:277 stop:402 length:126 start_codon:yes stop_codon:yes gene_type:complete